MSNISSTHTIVNNTNGKAEAFSGNRLVTCWWKQTAEMKKEGKQAHFPVAASIPTVDEVEITGNISALLPHITSMLEGVQDKIIRKYSELGRTYVTDSDISVSACIMHLEAENISTRLTGDRIASWFDSSIADVLSVALADKMGVSDIPTDAQTQRLSQMIASVRGKLVTLASPKTTFSVDHAKKLITILEYASDDDVLAQRFIQRLSKVQQQEADIFDSL
jgi:hypothetical protein